MRLTKPFSHSGVGILKHDDVTVVGDCFRECGQGTPLQGEKIFQLRSE